MTNFCVWSRSCLERPSILSGAGANLIGSEPVSAPGPWATGAGAAHKSGGSATLDYTILLLNCQCYKIGIVDW